MNPHNLMKKYEIDNEPFDFGTYGCIYMARNKINNKEYVLKKLRKINPNILESEKIIKKSFESEKLFFENVKGTNILKMEECGEDEKYYYLILEKMDGNLKQMLTNYKNGMPSKMIKKIFSQINSGLKIMIKEGICHRDLKPDNIFYSYINKEKNDFIIKIGDFGLSTDLTSNVEYKTNAGNFYYKAPEVEKGVYNNKCDLYSIGIILYNLKTNDYIFEGETLVERVNNQFQNKFKRKIDDDKLLNDLIEKLVVYEPKDRINWVDYFKHPFFKDNENESKIKYKLKIIKFFQIIQ